MRVTTRRHDADARTDRAASTTVEPVTRPFGKVAEARRIQRR
jgi:hypothetical protein